MSLSSAFSLFLGAWEQSVPEIPSKLLLGKLLEEFEKGKEKKKGGENVKMTYGIKQITEEDKNELVKKLSSSIIRKQFPNAVEDAKDDICPVCKQKITEFRNSQSIDEYKISGLCQNCQDKFFGFD